MKRRDFIKLIGSAAATWPQAARAQQSKLMRRVGVLYPTPQTDPQGQAGDAAFRKQLNELGWVDGRTVHIEYRWAAGNIDRIQLFAKELVRLNPDVLVAVTTPATAALTRNANNSYRVRRRIRSDRFRLRCQPGPSRRQHHRLQRSRSLVKRQMA
jgi:putative tryptophan/tyrosine transport system substrate-binding protein